MSSEPTSRAERRERTRARILTAARDLFAENGFDRTTIRAVATAAATDPALVMRYFGSKEELFRQVAEAGAEPPIEGSPGRVEDLLLAALRDKLTTGDTGTLALLRSMLTHPAAAEGVRQSITEQQRQVAAGLGGEDAMTRAALVGMITLAAVLGRDLLKLEGLHGADPEVIIELLRPAVQTLIR
ncbi:TetR/AcrR family transcriptional regulator [Microlunatus parietis]|uniref:AcrR family transcriptional regulator n=1 Tax=Microlunatus parietis TaxID=682979 RepID=A0A7Y9LCX9_9ACTN|nr:TetR/AcrR family transcriptional regulator [Microlunatus parietis]NYE72313.1 AcrR family transcriptional regulator [Microlunatus parietis]